MTSLVNDLKAASSNVEGVHIENFRDLKSRIRSSNEIYIVYCSFSQNLCNTVVNVAQANAKRFCLTDKSGKNCIAGGWGDRDSWYIDDTIFCNIMENGESWVGKFIDS